MNIFDENTYFIQEPKPYSFGEVCAIAVIVVAVVLVAIPSDWIINFFVNLMS